jgi:hypothetical protein
MGPYATFVLNKIYKGIYKTPLIKKIIEKSVYFKIFYLT